MTLARSLCLGRSSAFRVGCSRNGGLVVVVAGKTKHTRKPNKPNAGPPFVCAWDRALDQASEQAAVSGGRDEASTHRRVVEGVVACIVLLQPLDEGSGVRGDVLFPYILPTPLEFLITPRLRAHPPIFPRTSSRTSLERFHLRLLQLLIATTPIPSAFILPTPACLLWEPSLSFNSPAFLS